MVSPALLAFVALIMSLLISPVVRDSAVGRGLVDSPDHDQVGARKLHRLQIPQLGGVAIFVAYSGSFIVLVWSA